MLQPPHPGGILRAVISLASPPQNHISADLLPPIRKSPFFPAISPLLWHSKHITPNPEAHCGFVHRRLHQPAARRGFCFPGIFRRPAEATFCGSDFLKLNFLYFQ